MEALGDLLDNDVVMSNTLVAHLIDQLEALRSELEDENPGHANGGPVRGYANGGIVHETPSLAQMRAALMMRS